MPPSGVIEAVDWIEQLMLGSASTVSAILAVAIVGLQMLDGRLVWRRGAQIVIGCFLIFGSPTIATGLLSSATTVQSSANNSAVEAIVPPLPPRPPEHYDPYAGAALPPGW